MIVLVKQQYKISDLIAGNSLGDGYYDGYDCYYNTMVKKKIKKN